MSEKVEQVEPEVVQEDGEMEQEELIAMHGLTELCSLLNNAIKYSELGGFAGSLKKVIDADRIDTEDALERLYGEKRDLGYVPLAAGIVVAVMYFQELLNMLSYIVSHALDVAILTGTYFVFVHPTVSKWFKRTYQHHKLPSSLHPVGRIPEYAGIIHGFVYYVAIKEGISNEVIQPVDELDRAVKKIVEYPTLISQVDLNNLKHKNGKVAGIGKFMSTIRITVDEMRSIVLSAGDMDQNIANNVIEGMRARAYA